MLSPAKGMFRWTAVGVLAVGGFVSTPGAQQPASGAAPPAEAPHHALVNTYCLSCHNNKTKTAGLALDTINRDELGQLGGLGKGRPKASRTPDAARGRAATR